MFRMYFLVKVDFGLNCLKLNKIFDYIVFFYSSFDFDIVNVL